MERLLLWIGRLGGIAGIVLMAIAVVARLQGRFMVGDYQVGTMLIVGIAGLVVGCFGYAAAVAERPR